VESLQRCSRDRRGRPEALATFADMQQKYPTLLARYRPMVQKADLGYRGVWFRLRIGPIATKEAATKLCGQLKSQGHPDCLVMAAQPPASLKVNKPDRNRRARLRRGYLGHEGFG
jgi:hypothetical protein